MRAMRRDDGMMSLLGIVLVSGMMLGPTVMLPAAAYVWVSGFGAQSSVPASSLSLTSEGPLDDGQKSYLVASSSPGLTYQALAFVVDGVTRRAVGTCEPTSQLIGLCRGGQAANMTDDVRAGDVVMLADVREGATLRVLDARANSVILTLVVR